MISVKQNVASSTSKRTGDKERIQWCGRIPVRGGGFQWENEDSRGSRRILVGLRGEQENFRERRRILVGSGGF